MLPILLALSPAVLGQEAEPASEAAQRRVVEEIIVTAQKKEQSVADVPISLSVVDAQFVQDAGITDFRDLSLFVPNVSVNNLAGQFNDVRIRGFGTPLSNKAFEQSVGLVVDGIPYGRLAYWQGTLFDLERVEVLRGPQGTLFGKNTTAGLFSVVTKRPTDEFTGYVHAELGELDRRRFEAAIGGPLVQNAVNFRLAGLSDERDGYVRNTTAEFISGAHDRMNSRDRKAARIQVGFPDLVGADVVVSYEILDLHTNGVGWEFRSVVPNQIPFFREYDPKVDLEKGNWIGSNDGADFVDSKINTVAVNAGYGIGEWSLNAVTGYSKLETVSQQDNDFVPAPIVPISDRDDNPQIVFELRADSPSLGGFLGLERLLGLGLGSTDFIAGVFFLHRRLENSKIGFNINFPVLAQFLATDATGVVPPCPECSSESAFETETLLFDQTTKSIAGFSHLNWHLAERWTLEYGMRFMHETKDAEWVNRCTRGNPCPGFTALIRANDFTASRSRSEFAFTPKISLRYDWTDEVGLYAGWGSGFKAGGFNATIFSDSTEEAFSFRPEKASSWELGAKTRLLGGAAALDLALFRMEVTDLQLLTLTPDFASLVENAGEARSQGVEADLTWFPTEWLTIRGAAGLNDATYIEYPIGSCPFDRPNTDGDEDNRCDLSGKRPEFTPKWTSTLAPSLRLPLGTMLGRAAPFPFSAPGIELLGGLILEYKSAFFAQTTLDPRSVQPSFVRLGASIGLGNSVQGWSVRLVGENLTDEATAVHIRDVSIAGKSFSQLLEPPRLIHGAFRWEF